MGLFTSLFTLFSFPVLRKLILDPGQLGLFFVLSFVSVGYNMF
jgi:hypothetical protein